VSEPGEGARVDPPLHGDEVTTLRSFLTYHRDTLRWKCAAMTQEELAQRLPPSDMSLGGLMKHLALVESQWFDYYFLGGEIAAPFDSVDWDADPEWEFETARLDTPDELLALYDETVSRSDATVDDALGRGGLEQDSVRRSRHVDSTFTLRWILVHLIEEYARHNGHADLIRESIDGQKGE
jgi:uncharacterized damage-inducible protein DinB